MEEPKVLISKKSIRTMGKDMVRLKRDDVDFGKDGKDESKALIEEMRRREEEEARLKKLRARGEEVVKNINGEEEETLAEKPVKESSVDEEKIAAEEAKKAERARLEGIKQVQDARAEEIKQAKRLAALQEARKWAAEEEARRKKEHVPPVAEKKVEKPVFVETVADKKEEPVKAEPPAAEETRELLLENRKKNREEKEKIRQNLRDFEQKKAPLEEKRRAVSKEIEGIELIFGGIESQEKEIEKKYAEIEGMEAAAKSPEEKKKFEKSRWGIEEKRRKLEKDRWPLDEKIEQLESGLRLIEKEEKEIDSEEKELILKRDEIDRESQEIDLKLERISLLAEMEKNEEIKASFESKVNDSFKRLEEAKNGLNVVLGQEEEIEGEKKLIEAQEGGAGSLSERREAEKIRWQMEEKRRNIESERWKLEAEKDKLSQNLNFLQSKLKEVLNKKENMSKRLDEINKSLSGEPLGEEQKIEASPLPQDNSGPQSEPQTGPPPAPQTEKSSVKEVDLTEKILESKPKAEEKLEGKPVEEKLEIIEDERRAKIEEARKRIEILKKVALEKKQRQEQMRKAVLSPVAKQKLVSKPVKPESGGEEKRKALLKRLSMPISMYDKQDYDEREERRAEKKETNIPDSREIIRVVPKKPSFREKLWVRSLIVAVILVILAGILTFWYWYFVIRSSGPVYPPGYEREREGIQIPPSLFSVGDTTIITITEDKELKDAISKVLEKSLPAGQFKRIVIKKEGKILGIKDMFDILSVSVSENFYNNISDEPTMFVYSQGQGNRFGFVTKISGASNDLNVVLKSMEPTMETDFENLFALMGKEGRATAPYFKDASAVEGYEGVNFRFKTLNQNDLGICYSISDFYFVFSSSWESMSNLLVNTENYLSTRVLIRDLKAGDSGEHVRLLQKWLAKELDIYEGDLASGTFDAATKDAVIRFQEKYRVEILTPQGRSQGTGIADLATRKKLNQLYSEL